MNPTRLIDGIEIPDGNKEFFIKGDGSLDETNYRKLNDFSFYMNQQEKYKFFKIEELSKNPPIVSPHVQNGTSTLVNPVFVSPVSGTGLSNNFSCYTGEITRADYVKATDTFSGTFPDYQYVKNIAVTTTNSFGNIMIEFTFDGSALELVEKGQAGKFQIYVDEGTGYKKLTHLTQSAGPSNGSKYLRKISFPDRRLRKIKVHYVGLYFGGVWVSFGDIVSPAIRRIGKKAIFFGNSFTEGTGGDAAFNNYANTTSTLLGLECWSSGSGGTGFINSGTAGRVKFQDRVVRDVIHYSPDIVVIEGGNNDTTFDQTDLLNAVNLLVSTIKTSLPTVTIYLLSNFQLQGSTENIINTRNTIKAAALANSVYFIDSIDGVSYNTSGVAITQKYGPWIVGPGSVGNIQETGNASLYVASDLSHPSREGHRYIGERLALEMQRLSGGDFFNTIGTTNPEFDQKLPTTGSYTPTVSNSTNATGINLQLSRWTKVGTVYTIRINLGISGVDTINTVSTITFNLPENRTTSSPQAIGSGCIGSGGDRIYPVMAVSQSNSTVTLYLTESVSEIAGGSVTLIYDIKE